MSQLPDLPPDVPCTRTYLTLVEDILDQVTFQDFIARLQVFIKVLSSQDHNLYPNALLHTVSVLRRQPDLVDGFNTLLRPDQRLHFSRPCEEVTYFVLVDGPNATIYSTSCTGVPRPSTTEELRRYVDKDSWKKLLASRSDKGWLACLSQLLLVIVDHPCDPTIGRRAYRCLRELSAMTILPPSVFIDIPTRAATLVPEDGGAFADIYSGELKGIPVCYRVLRMFETNVDDRQRFLKQFCSELGVWRQLNHPNILPLIGVNLELFAPRFCFISPWLAHGNIMSYLKKHPDHDRFTSVCDIVNGIEYLHGLGPPVTHKDIKGANVLVRDDLVCCLADFGLSSIVESQRLSGYTSPAFAGSVCWLAPELMDPRLVPTKNEKAGDIYALACTIYEIYTGKPPFSDTGMQHVAIMFAVVNKERPSLPPPHPSNRKWTDDELTLWMLVDLCWMHKPEDRPEIRLVKNTLQDIGSRTPPVRCRGQAWKTERRDDFHPGNMLDLREAQNWLEETRSRMLVSSPKQDTRTANLTSRDHRSSDSCPSKPAKDGTPSGHDRARLQHPCPDQGGYRKSVYRLSIATPRKPTATQRIPLGLRTPDTPSHPMCDAELPEVSDAEFMGNTPNVPFISGHGDRALDTTCNEVDLDSNQASKASRGSSSSRLVINTQIPLTLPTPPSTPGPRTSRQLHPPGWSHAQPSASAHRLQFGSTPADAKSPLGGFSSPRGPRVPQAATLSTYSSSPLRRAFLLPHSSAIRGPGVADTSSSPQSPAIRDTGPYGQSHDARATRTPYGKP